MKLPIILTKIPIVLMIVLSFLLFVPGLLWDESYFVVTLPMLILGWFGWSIGRKKERKYPEKRWLTWDSLMIGLAGFFIGLLVGSALSFLFLPCGWFGC